MTSTYPYHLPRLYVPEPLIEGAEVSLSEAQAHYLKNVMRLGGGADARVFNAANGEWLANLSFPSKKRALALPRRILKSAENIPVRRHLVFSPIKKDRMDWMIEKAVELGVTDLHPVLMRRSVIRDIKPERIEMQIIEAAEQCERMDIPVLHPILSLDKFLQQFSGQSPLYAAIERQENAAVLSGIKVDGDFAFLVGPEGGFDPEEIELLTAQNFTRPASLGPRILRAETAALFGLSVLIG